MTPTKTILFADLLNKQIDAPIDWTFGMVTSCWGWYHFVQTVRIDKDTTIKKVTLNMEVTSHRSVLGIEGGNNPVKFNFNETPIKGPEQFADGSYGWRLWHNERRLLTIDVTDKFRIMTGEVPQLLSVAIYCVYPGHHGDITLTAYMDIDYEGSEPAPVGTGGGKEATGTESLGEMVTFIMNMMLIMMFMSMMVSMMTAITGMAGGS